MADSDTFDVETSWQPSVGTHPSINLPLAFKIYYRKARLTHFEFYIAHSKEGPVLHAISGGWEGFFKSKIGLHQGPEIDSPSLGSAIIKHKAVEITLPSSGTQHTMQTTPIKFRTQSNEGSFDFPVPGIPAPEHFVWRDSRGPEVQSLENRDKTGWVLLRVGHGTELEGEPVAAYAYDPWSWKLSGHFAFLNSGRTEALGGDWAVMAVLTALCLGQKKRVQYSGTTPVFVRD
jgi:hypothetical protein